MKLPPNMLRDKGRLMELEVEVFGSFDPVQFEVFGPDYDPVLEITFKQVTNSPLCLCESSFFF